MGIVAAYVLPHPPIIVPEVGKGRERAVQATIDAFRAVSRRIARHAPDTIVLSSPHAPAFRDCFHLSTGDGAYGDLGAFGAWEASMRVAFDDELVAAIAACARMRELPVCAAALGGSELDHASFVPLSFVNACYRDYRLVRIGLSGLSADMHRRLGRCVAEAAGDIGRRCVYLASGDLSHKLLPEGPYGFDPAGPAFDEQVTGLLAAGDLDGLFAIDEGLCEAAAECGLRSFQIMAGALEGLPVEHELFSYEGPFGVGYAVAAFEDARKDAEGGEGEAAKGRRGEGAAPRAKAARPSRPDPYVELARASVEGLVRGGREIALPEGLPDELVKKRAGVFVSLHEGGRLRGCIGSVEPALSCVAREIVRNAAAAASEDPRFPPVREAELDALEYSVDELGELQPISSTDQLDPRRFGVLVSKGRRRGLLLPGLEGIDSAEEQVGVARRKAGIAADEDGVALERFETVRHERGGGARRA